MDKQRMNPFARSSSASSLFKKLPSLETEEPRQKKAKQSDDDVVVTGVKRGPGKSKNSSHLLTNPQEINRTIIIDDDAPLFVERKRSPQQTQYVTSASAFFKRKAGSLSFNGPLQNTNNSVTNGAVRAANSRGMAAPARSGFAFYQDETRTTGKPRANQPIGTVAQPGKNHGAAAGPRAMSAPHLGHGQGVNGVTQNAVPHGSRKATAKHDSWQHPFRSDEGNKTNQPSAPLSPEQQHVARLVVQERKSLFFTGNAGTGKSFLLRELIRQLRERYGRSSVAVTASTGIAACNISGTTLHSFAGIGLGNGSAEKLTESILGNRKTMARWRDVTVLIIDEISMIDGALFDKLEHIARRVRGTTAPFGGIQLVLCGDFMQLPPGIFISFEAKTWKACVPVTVQLTHVFRQKDPKFVKILNEMRVANMSEESNRILRTLARDLVFDDGIQPTKLYIYAYLRFSLREEVERANSSRLQALKGRSVVYEATDSSTDPIHLKKIRDSCLAPDKVELRLNAQVMLIKNDSEDRLLVNGTIGIVIGFTKEQNPIVKFAVGYKGETREKIVEKTEWTIEIPSQNMQLHRVQMPLILAWAMYNPKLTFRSIHKSQGQTISRLSIDMSSIFENGQAYVALSRGTALEGVQVVGYSPDKVRVHPKVVDFHRMLAQNAAIALD